MSEHVDDILDIIDAGLQRYDGRAGGNAPDSAPDSAYYRGVRDNRDACWRCQDDDAGDRYDGACEACAAWLDGGDNDPLEDRVPFAWHTGGPERPYVNTGIATGDIAAGVHLDGNTLVNNSEHTLWVGGAQIPPGMTVEVAEGAVIYGNQQAATDPTLVDSDAWRETVDGRLRAIGEILGRDDSVLRQIVDRIIANEHDPNDCALCAQMHQWLGNRR